MAKNYITTLRAEVAELRAARAATLDALAEFRAHLASAKFRTEETGDRKDWIATSDVNTRLHQIRDTLCGLA